MRSSAAAKLNARFTTLRLPAWLYRESWGRAVKSILIVDDCPIIRGVLTMALEQAGHAVYTAENGLEALALLARIHPDLMLLDLHMPQLGGLEVLRAVKEHGLRPQMPVVMLTGDSDDWALVEAHARQAAGYLHKPFETDVLLWRVERLLSDPDMLWMDDEHVLKRERPAPDNVTLFSRRAA